MMWYVGCPLLSVDIIKVMRLVGEGGTNILPRAAIPGYFVYLFLSSFPLDFSRLEFKVKTIKYQAQLLVKGTRLTYYT